MKTTRTIELSDIRHGAEIFLTSYPPHTVPFLGLSNGRVKTSVPDHFGVPTERTVPVDHIEAVVIYEGIEEHFARVRGVRPDYAQTDRFLALQEHSADPPEATHADRVDDMKIFYSAILIQAYDRDLDGLIELAEELKSSIEHAPWPNVNAQLIEDLRTIWSRRFGRFAAEEARWEEHQRARCL